MRVHQAYRFELDPNDRVRSALASHCGASRFAYNWGLALVKLRLEGRDAIRQAALRELLSDTEVERLARTVEVPWSLPALRREWNRSKADAAPWWMENSKEAYSSGFDALARALEAFSKAKKGERAGTIGFPRAKKRGSQRKCRFTTGAIHVVDDRHVQLPRIGIVRSKEPATKLRQLLDEGRAGYWSRYGSRRPPSSASTSECCTWPCCRRARWSRTRRPCPAMTAGWPGSTGSSAAARRARSAGRGPRPSWPGATAMWSTLAAMQINKLTTELAATCGTVVVEDLNVVGMTAKPKPVRDGDGGYAPNGRRRKAGLNRVVLDVSPSEVRHQLAYKLEWKGGRLIVADRFFPSSKICSRCGAVKAKLPLSERIYRCDCGLAVDRDFNAALNLAAHGRRVVDGSGPETQNARGGGHPRPRSKPPMKREDGTGEPGRTVTVSSQEEAA